jgi:hypothetical protein
MSDRLTTILDAIVAKITARGFAINGVTLPVVKRKAPIHRQKMDPRAMITVSKSVIAELVTRRRFGLWQTAYNVDVTVVSPYTGPDNDIQEYSTIRDTIVDDFKRVPLAGAPEVFELDCGPTDWLRPLGETTEWDWQSLVITATVAHV